MENNSIKPHDTPVAKAKGRPMLTWVGKKSLSSVKSYPAQAIERFEITNAENFTQDDLSWKEWPTDLPVGGLLYHGDNKDVLAHLLANGFRGKINLIYIDPPFDSGADYVRKVELRGASGKIKIDGEDYTLGEQIQYSDIWANDNYLQFMYERLLMLKMLLAPSGVIYLHCDSSRNSYLRLIMDEVFGSDAFNNEIVWHYYNKMQGNINRFASNHDVILSYRNWDKFKFTTLREARDKPKTQQKRVWDGATKTLKQARDENGKLVYYQDTERTIDDVWALPYLMPADKTEKLDYPTQKPETVLERIIESSSQVGDLVLDCFIGSGTTAAVAQRLGRRWIGCDINKGAIHTTTKRLQELMSSQAKTAKKPKQGKLIETESAKPKPSQLSFATYRVNDYDLQIQHNEAVGLACEHLGVTRVRTDSFFDGTLGGRLVKIVAFNHPLTPLDLESVRNELKARPSEERDITIVCLGWQQDANAWVSTYNQNRPINKFHVIELRTDRKFGGIIRHEPLIAQINVQRVDTQLVVEVLDVISPTIMQRLSLEQDIFRANITDWRAVVDCILIDTKYDGVVFNVVHADVPSRKENLVEGRYELSAPPSGSTVAVKIVDMLGEELVFTQQV